MANVLVVDDIDVVRLAICSVLMRAGHTVVSAADGGQALSLVKRHPPDAVITDMWMPGGDGLGLIRALKAEFPAVAVVAMSGGSRHYGPESSLDTARRAGVTHLLMKPIDNRDLITAISAALEARQGPMVL